MPNSSHIFVASFVCLIGLLPVRGQGGEGQGGAPQEETKKAKSSQDVEALVARLDHENLVVRLAATRALVEAWQGGVKTAYPAMKKHGKQVATNLIALFEAPDADRWIKAQVLNALQYLGGDPKETLPFLDPLLDDRTYRVGALRALSGIGQPAWPLLLSLASGERKIDTPPSAIAWRLHALRPSPPNLDAVMVDLALGRDQQSLGVVLDWMWRRGKAGLPGYSQLLKRGDARVRAKTVSYLAMVGQKYRVDVSEVFALLSSGERNVDLEVFQTLKLLASYMGGAYKPGLRRGWELQLQSDSGTCRFVAKAALAHLADPKAHAFSPFDVLGRYEEGQRLLERERRRKVALARLQQLGPENASELRPLIGILVGRAYVPPRISRILSGFLANERGELAAEAMAVLIDWSLPGFLREEHCRVDNRLVRRRLGLILAHKDPRFRIGLDALELGLADPESAMRLLACSICWRMGRWAVGLGGTLLALTMDEDEDVRRSAGRALLQVIGPTIHTLPEIGEVRRKSIESLSSLIENTELKGRGGLLASLSRLHALGPWARLRMLTLRCSPRELAPWIARIGFTDPLSLRCGSIRWLAGHPAGIESVTGTFLSHMRHADPEIRLWCARGLGFREAAWRWKIENQINALLLMQHDWHPEVRLAVLRSVRRLGQGTEPAIQAYVVALADRSSSVASEAARALGSLGHKARRALPALREASTSKHRALQLAATEAIGLIES